VGDPQWIDQNGDYLIDDNDRVMKGNQQPKFFGGFNNTVAYKNWSMNMNWYFALGHSALNQRAANTYDFINLENTNSIESVREVFFWQQDVDISKYPIYNPWSNSNPYQLNQDLFVENLSYLKLRSITLGYDFKDAAIFNKNRKVFKTAYLYVAGNNLLTLSKFSGIDPELVTASGYYSGYALPIPRTFTLGVQLSF